MYDDIDMRHRYNTGFWIGVVAGIAGITILEAFVGLYIAH